MLLQIEGIEIGDGLRNMTIGGVQVAAVRKEMQNQKNRNGVWLGFQIKQNLWFYIVRNKNYRKDIDWCCCWD